MYQTKEEAFIKRWCRLRVGNLRYTLHLNEVTLKQSLLPQSVVFFSNFFYLTESEPFMACDETWLVNLNFKLTSFEDGKDAAPVRQRRQVRQVDRHFAQGEDNHYRGRRGTWEDAGQSNGLDLYDWRVGKRDGWAKRKVGDSLNSLFSPSYFWVRWLSKITSFKEIHIFIYRFFFF